MPLINCPECRHAVSTNAAACPNCGFILPLEEPIVVRNVIEPESDRKMPQWIIFPAIGVVAVIFVIIFILLSNKDDESANARNVSVDLTKTQRTPSPQVRTVESEPPSQIIVPPNSTTSNPPPPSSAVEPPQRTTVPATAPTVVAAPDKGIVKIEAKVTTKNGSVQSVKNEKFYLLDKDVESILREADLEPIEYNSLMNSFGLSVMYPDRYTEFNREALNAIKKHIKYSGLTDSSGQASLKDVEPDSYHLFGITKSKTGFAVWSSPVNINNGENILNLSPAGFNEIGE